MVVATNTVAYYYITKLITAIKMFYDTDPRIEVKLGKV
jgi:hypothetical protein